MVAFTVWKSSYLVLTGRCCPITVCVLEKGKYVCSNNVVILAVVKLLSFCNGDQVSYPVATNLNVFNSTLVR